MKAFIISDKEYQTETLKRIRRLICGYLTEQDFEMAETQTGREDLAFCVGCFGCWVKKPGECVIGDAIGPMNRTMMNSDVVIYLCPVVFGQFSANIKNTVDRWLPNMLPFFETRPDGSTMHPPRYVDYPAQIMIGYGDALTSDDAQLFIDITKKHRSNVEVLIFKDDETELVNQLNNIELKRKGGQL